MSTCGRLAAPHRKNTPLSLYDPPVKGESRKERHSRWRSNAMTTVLLATVAFIMTVMLWVIFAVAPDVALWSRP